MDIVKRILHLMEQKGVRTSEMLKEAGLNHALMTQWKKGLAKPGTEAIIKLAEYFNVSCDWIMTGKNFEYEKGFGSLFEEEKKIISDYRLLNKEGQKHLRLQLYMLLKTFKKVGDYNSDVEISEEIG